MVTSPVESEFKAFQIYNKERVQQQKIQSLAFVQTGGGGGGDHVDPNSLFNFLL